MKRLQGEEKAGSQKPGRTGMRERTGRGMRDGKRKEKAWIYTHIDASEDSHGALKNQYETAEYLWRGSFRQRLQAAPVTWEANQDWAGPGLELFLGAKESRGIEVLLVLDSTRISRDGKLYRNSCFG